MTFVLLITDLGFVFGIILVFYTNFSICTESYNYIEISYSKSRIQISVIAATKDEIHTRLQESRLG